MKAHTGAQDSHSTGQCQPAAAEHVGNAKSREDAAEDMQRTGGNAADEEKVKVFRTVFCQVADIFEGGEAHSDGNGHAGQLLRLRLKDEKIEQQGQKLHDFLADRCDFDGGQGGVTTIIAHEKAAHVGGQQADGHADHGEQGKTAGAAFCEKHGQQQGDGKTDENVFNIGHDGFTSRNVRGSRATKAQVRVMSTAKYRLKWV